MTEVCGEVADGILVHGFTTERYLREVTMPALERGLGAGRARPRRLRDVGPVFVVTGDDRRARSAAAVTGTRKQIAFYGSTPAYRARARAARLGRPADELQRAVEAGRVGRDGRADRRRGARRVRRRRPASTTIGAALRSRCAGSADRVQPIFYAASGNCITAALKEFRQ